MKNLTLRWVTIFYTNKWFSPLKHFPSLVCDWNLQAMHFCTNVSASGLQELFFKHFFAFVQMAPLLSYKSSFGGCLVVMIVYIAPGKNALSTKISRSRLPPSFPSHTPGLSRSLTDVQRLHTNRCRSSPRVSGLPISTDTTLFSQLVKAN